MKRLAKRDFPVAGIRRFLEPGPIVRYPETFHHRGEGAFMISGRNVTRRARFRPGML